MLVLITPNHLLIGLLIGIAAMVLPEAALPTGLGAGADLLLQHGQALGLVVLLGLVTAAAQYLLSLAYTVADATYLQPFDDLKLRSTRCWAGLCCRRCQRRGSGRGGC